MLGKVRSRQAHGEAAECNDRGNEAAPLLRALLTLECVPKPAEVLIERAVASLVVNLQRRAPLAEWNRWIPRRSRTEMVGPGLADGVGHVVRETIVEVEPRWRRIEQIGRLGGGG